ncbi:hypothetical protein [Streptomyces radicis]|uniref:Uncharacterized protein n=1 Tax=Streptomyces radicis TaxID=1750517 RepID=A0A3A9WD61_9ACTN|nr:hypothetical protein [Streptomyces radicis]RKN10925.1 hypothetical protein D7319_07220 [Streptomyces radicis]RKN25188.1 hypothetical protein D7318_08075 [Streptomyces radicis]
MDAHIVLRVVAPDADHGEIAVVRLLSLLPGRWHYRHHAEPDRIGLSIAAPGASPDEIRAVVGAALATAPALRRWRLEPPP